MKSEKGKMKNEGAPAWPARLNPGQAFARERYAPYNNVKRLS
jgi:hypothetical protein